ncbi:flagellar export chaperone FliS [Bacillus tuaregi]|uniref:flagellar export chaperone FliS n=1 Tax=Bacillus tuaregi TaxID=1816695 RepID=UPI000A7E29FB|nr:flagellar export chaperone FliS [Bacillus tuaregi]
MSDFLTKEMIYQKSSQEITSLLYESCLTSLEEAIEHINSKDYILANQRLQKANDILERLGVGLNYDAGIISDQLDMMYNYMAGKLIEANLNKDPNIIQEVIKILEDITQAWNQALKKPTKPIGQNRMKAMAYEKNILVEN